MYLFRKGLTCITNLNYFCYYMSWTLKIIFVSVAFVAFKSTVKSTIYYEVQVVCVYEREMKECWFRFNLTMLFGQSNCWKKSVVVCWSGLYERLTRCVVWIISCSLFVCLCSKRKKMQFVVLHFFCSPAFFTLGTIIWMLYD